MFQARPPIAYTYDCFGVGDYHRQFLKNVDEKEMRDVQGRSLKVAPLHSLEGISEQAVLPQLRSPQLQYSMQQRTQNLVSNIFRGYPGNYFIV